MERRDQKITKEVTWERNYNAGNQTDREDLSTVEFSGSKDEADVIIAGLQVLLGRLIENQALHMSSNSRKPLIHVEAVEKLLCEIEHPNYITEPKVIKTTSPQ